MKEVKVRVYKHYFPGEELDYSFRVGDKQKSLGFRTIKSLAKSTREFVSGLRTSKRSMEIIISIDFSSEHDVLCLPGLPPKRYFRLSEFEQQEFWEEFTAS
jgi:hypothetical protein